MSERAHSQLKQNSPISLTPVTSGVLQRKCACGNHTAAGGECAKNKTGLQQKLSIGASNDPLEQEADRVADQVMTTPMISGALPRIQRYKPANYNDLTSIMSLPTEQHPNDSDVCAVAGFDMKTCMDARQKAKKP